MSVTLPAHLAKKTAGKYRRGRWNTSIKKVNSLQWNHPEIGDLVITAGNFDLGTPRRDGGSMWAPIVIGTRQPEELELSFATAITGGDQIYTYYRAPGSHLDPQVMLCEGNAIPSFKVAVDWTLVRPGNSVPFVVAAGGTNNVDIFYALPNGTWFKLEVAVLYRPGLFYVSVQEIGVYRTVRLAEGVLTTKMVCDVNGERYTFIPEEPEQAFPGADYLKSLNSGFVGRGDRLMRLLVRDCVDGNDKSLIPTVDSVDYPDWDPPAFPTLTDEQRASGLVGARTCFGNPIVRIISIERENGSTEIHPLRLIVDDDGESVWDKGGFPVAQGREALVIQLGAPQRKGTGFDKRQQKVVAGRGSPVAIRRLPKPSEGSEAETNVA